MRIINRIAALMACGLVVGTAALGLNVITAPPAAASTKCSVSLCMYQDKNGGGSVLKGLKGTSGDYSNLSNFSFNDKISSIYNEVSNVQSFWTNKDYKGTLLRVGAYQQHSDLKQTSGGTFHDSISSVKWKG
ncbi:MAG: beta/gamma crystallin family protein [Bifidobacteriaceae bacterium]|jgi:hypothetical protein|nr:beta/gamma crystallin family protein [Bifidobacteriaceae bacterium]